MKNSQLVLQLVNTDDDELESQYGIQIDWESGSVYDPIENTEYESVEEWAERIVQDLEVSPRIQKTSRTKPRRSDD